MSLFVMIQAGPNRPFHLFDHAKKPALPRRASRNHLEESSFVQIAELLLVAWGRGVSALHSRLLSGLLRRNAALVAALRRIVALSSLIWLIHVLRHKDSPLPAIDEHHNQPTRNRRLVADGWLP